MYQGINPSSELDLFKSNLPKKPYFSYLNYFQEIRPKYNKYLVQYSHIQFNHPQYIKYICIDIDLKQNENIKRSDFDDEVSFLLAQVNIFDIIEYSSLKPNLAIVNRSNGKGHLFFRLNTAVSKTENSSKKAINALKKIIFGLNNYLGGDHCYRQHLAKNPFFIQRDNEDSFFKIHSFNKSGFDFDDFFENIPDHCFENTKEHKKKDVYLGLDIEAEGIQIGQRNDYLFNQTRLKSYALKSKYHFYSDFYDAVEKEYTNLNNKLPDPLDYTEANQSINSIAKWTWANYDGDYKDKNRGVMQLDLHGPDLNKQERQVAGANYTAKIKRNGTLTALIDVFNTMQAEGVKVTQKAVAERSGKGIATVKRYWKQINK